MEKYIKESDILYARLHKGKRELLIDHSKKTLFFYQELKKRHRLDDILERILNRLTFDENPLEKGIKEKIVYFFEQAILLHDIGKINPVFQVQKMKNEKIKLEDGYSDSNHSLLSALLYLDIFLEETKDVDEEQQNFLHHVLYAFAYCISRHHGSLGDLRELNDAGKISEPFYQKLKNLMEVIIKKTRYIDFYVNKEHLLSNFKIEQFQDTENFRYHDGHEPFSFYILCKLLFSAIVSCDSLATQSYIKGKNTELFHLTKTDKQQLRSCYESTNLYQKISEYKRNHKIFKDEPINELRSQLFWDVDEEVQLNPDKNIYYLEAPTGSGKTNVSINIALRLLQKHDEAQRLIYVFPFNTLIDQTQNTFEEIFPKELREKYPLHVINSVTPIDHSSERDEEIETDYDADLTLHQMLQYPMTMTSHVNFFNYLFGLSRENNLGFIHLCNSVIILDEIQSYRNKIWIEISRFLYEFSECLNLKIIIMSATMPDLARLIDNNVQFHPLLKNRDSYFLHPLFKKRVNLHFELLKKTFDRDSLLEELCELIKKHGKKRYLIEFIKKETARDIYEKLTLKFPNREIIELTGDDNHFYREKILREINKKDNNSHEFLLKDVIIVATQVIEAGVDIDMDIGFKDISLLDSEEQFLGRINRSCLRDDCHAYFFHLDEASKIYKEDFRLEENLINPEYQMMLI
jgi:CRISPR-associated endonuclease/helicase Cas3